MNFPEQSVSAPIGLILGASATRLWNLTGEERIRRSLTKNHVGGFAADAAAAAQAPTCLMARADWVIDPALIAILAQTPDSALTTRQDGKTVILAAHVAGSDVAALAQAIMAPDDRAPLPAHLKIVAHDPASPSLYHPTLRKRLNPAVLPLTEATLDAAERATFASSYKGVTDLVTKYLWPAPARRVTRWCADLGITPNTVTFASFLLVLATPYFFLKGWFLIGLAAAWLMTFLDTVDGKLARCTLNYTKFGDIFDHGIDLISPPFWWLAWHYGVLAMGGYYPLPEASIWAVFGGYIVLRLQEGLFIKLFGIHIHVWRRFDSFFRLIVARRNPILIILTVFALGGEAGLGMTVTAVWTLISVAVHAVQIAQALLTMRKRPVISWMAE
jgi:phosphatidylglycerophosphate synthase